jgi:dihydroorotate dehydrogenase electron transfer subunit
VSVETIPTVRGRPGSGPVQARCEVLERRRAGAYSALTLAAPEIAARSRPGQFVNVAVDSRGSLLRRPFSIHRGGDTPSGGAIEIVFDPHGPGTGWLGTRVAGDPVDIVGPLGQPFAVPAEPAMTLLVGGGYGVAPLFYLAEQLLTDGHQVDMIVGAATGARLFDPDEAERCAERVVVTTDDGSVGSRGVVTDPLPDLVAERGTQLVYACGPMPMLRAVALRCAELEVRCQVAVEEHMACGVGVCWTCVVPVRDPADGAAMRRACVDGPVFDGSAIAWERTRWQPLPDREDFTPTQEVPVE